MHFVNCTCHKVTFQKLGMLWFQIILDLYGYCKANLNKYFYKVRSRLSSGINSLIDYVYSVLHCSESWLQLVICMLFTLKCVNSLFLFVSTDNVLQIKYCNVQNERLPFNMKGLLALLMRYSQEAHCPIAVT